MDNRVKSKHEMVRYDEFTSSSDTIIKEWHVCRKHRKSRLLDKYPTISTSSSVMSGIKIEIKAKHKKSGSCNDSMKIASRNKTVIRKRERPKSCNEATTSRTDTENFKNPIKMKLDKSELSDETTSTSANKFIISVQRKHKVPKCNEIVYNKTFTTHKKLRVYENHKQPELYDKKITYLLDGRRKDNPVNRKHKAQAEFTALDCFLGKPKPDEKQNNWHKLLPKQEDCQEIDKDSFCSTTDTYQDEKSTGAVDEYDDDFHDPSLCDRRPHRCAATHMAKPNMKPFKHTKFKAPWTCKSWLNSHLERCREYHQFTELNTMQQRSSQPNTPNVLGYPLKPPPCNWKTPKTKSTWLWPKPQYSADDYVQSCTPNFMQDSKTSPSLFQVLFGAVAVCLCLPCLIVYSLCHIRG